MAVTSGFFSSVHDDRKYDAKDIGDLFEGLVPNGIFSGIGNAFSSKVVNKTQASISSGLAYFNGYYFYNDDDIIVDIPEMYLVGIELEVPPQLEFPKWNRLYYDPDNIKVVGSLAISKEVKEIRVENPPQLDYPEGNTMYYDPKDLKVVASFGADDGWVYIVLQLNEISRSFSIITIGIEDYDPSKHLMIARTRRLGNDMEYRSLVGSSYTPLIYSYRHHYHNEETGEDTVTGSLVIDNLLSEMNDEEEAFKKEYFKEKTTWMAGKIEDWEYYLYQSGNQQIRMNNQISKKGTNAITLTGDININDDEIDLYAPNDVSNYYVDIFLSPNTLTINHVEIIGSAVIIKFDKALQKYKITARLQTY